MKHTVFESELIRTLEQRSCGCVHAAADWITVNNKAQTRVIKLKMQEGRLMPLIYPEEYENRYMRGESLDRMADEILEEVRRTQENQDIPEDFFQEYDDVKDGIFCRVVNVEKNRKLLTEVPHEIVENLAIVYFYELQEGWLEDATILIRNEHLDLWKRSACEVRKNAWNNTINKKKVRFCKLSKLLAEYGMADTEDMKNNPLYLLTNEQGGFGAAAAFYPKVLAMCAREMETDLILLPSSIHEWLLVPVKLDDCLADSDELRSMVQEINRTQLEEKEFLSDDIYYYDASLDRMSII